MNDLESGGGATHGAIGLVGLAVMGQNLALNLADHGATVVVYNRTTTVTDDFVGRLDPTVALRGVASLAELAAALPRPRRIILMVKAGQATDATIAELRPLLEPGDVIIDGGNSAWHDTERRLAELAASGLIYVGSGVSGGELGARFGPSIMPGGDSRAWPLVGDLLQAIAAHVDGEPCCSWIGPGGSGHFVKMVHNGIEYGDMQVIAEAYDLVQATGGSATETAAVFDSWRRGPLDSYLVDITADILTVTEPNGEPLVDAILDVAGQKGTGKWTVAAALDEAQPLTLVAQAVFARLVSGCPERRAAAVALSGPRHRVDLDADTIRDAVYAAKVVSYTQGFMLLRNMSITHSWGLDLAAIARLWRGGCIIRARFLDDIAWAFDADQDLVNLLLHPFFTDAIGTAQRALRTAVAAASLAGIPVPALSAALSFYDSIRAERLPTNLIQAQRDYFGAHTYERHDRPRGTFFHTDWTGHGGNTTSGAYSA